LSECDAMRDAPPTHASSTVPPPLTTRTHEQTFVWPCTPFMFTWPKALCYVLGRTIVAMHSIVCPSKCRTVPSLELVVASACAPTPPHRPRAPHPPACITVFGLTNTLSFSRLLRALPLPSYGEGEGGNGAGAAAVNAASSDGRTSPGKAGVAAHSATIDDPSLFVSRPMEETSVDQSDITHSTHSAHLDLTKW